MQLTLTNPRAGWTIRAFFQWTRILISAAAILVTGAAGSSDYWPSNEFVDSRGVRVEVYVSGESFQSSGFLWKEKDSVVTALHGIHPNHDSILVKCNGQILEATLSKTLKSEDLALLTADQEFAECIPFEDVAADPISGTKLWSYGWPGIDTGQVKDMRRGRGGKLENVVPDKVAEALREYGIPFMQTEVYYMIDGSEPGFSGGFIVNDDSQLVAIVDGGVSNRQSDISWAIPATKLDDLVAQDHVGPLERRSPLPRWLYSSPSAHPGKHVEIEYTEKDVLDNSIAYRWRRTKTLTLAEMAMSSFDPEETHMLLEQYRTPDGAGAPYVEPGILNYDIYKDQDSELIIALPANGRPNYKVVPDGEAHGRLESELGSTTVHYRSYAGVEEPPPQQCLPFAEAMIAGLLEQCAADGHTSCQADPDTIRMTTWDNGNKVLTAGVGYTEEDDSYGYEYHSFAVNNEVTFHTFTRLQDTGEGGPGLCHCKACRRICPNPNADQLTQMVAVQLTTFANPGTTTGGRETYAYANLCGERTAEARRPADDGGTSKPQVAPVPPNREVVDGTGETVRQFNNIKFATNRDQPTESSIPALREIYDLIQNDETHRFELVGHTDAEGDETYNQGLSERRADSVRTWLIAEGIDPAHLSSVGRGEQDPIATNATEAGKARNRRVELRRFPMNKD